MSDASTAQVTSREFALSEIDRADFRVALEAWETWRGADSLPVWNSGLMLALPSHFLRSATVVDVIDGGRDFRFRYWGSRLTEIFGVDDTGSLLGSHPGAFTQGTRIQLAKVLETGAPLFCVSTVVWEDRAPVEKINLRLPMCREPGMLDTILTVSNVDVDVPRDQQVLPWAQMPADE